LRVEEIGTQLKPDDVLVSQGHTITEVIRQIGVSEAACGTSCPIGIFLHGTGS
jgi:hypothetical protein